MKGPAATTLYGTEASNGVIQIITKRGLAGARPQIGFITEQGTLLAEGVRVRVLRGSAEVTAALIAAVDGCDRPK